MKYVEEGWPPIMPNVPLLRPYWDKKQHLTVNDGMLMYDKRIVIPQALQLGVLEQLHAGHLGITKCKGRAFNSVRWPAITAQMKVCAIDVLPVHYIDLQGRSLYYLSLHQKNTI